MALLVLQNSIEDKNYSYEAVLTAVEAGFEKHMFYQHVGFPYFMLVILYVLFDVEIIILYPLILAWGNPFRGVVNRFSLFFIVVITLLLE